MERLASFSAANPGVAPERNPEVVLSEFDLPEARQRKRHSPRASNFRQTLPEVNPVPLSIQDSPLLRTARQIAKRHLCHPLLAKVLSARGWKAGEELRQFLNPTLSDLPDKRQLKNLQPAAQEILHAVKSGKKIALCCDYDVDGVCCAVQLALLLRELGAKFTIIPADRFKGGYGLRPGHIKTARRRGCKLLIAADIGTNDQEALDCAAASELKTIIIDHHKVSTSSRLPPGTLLVNPSQTGCPFSREELCAAGLVFFVAAAIKEEAAKSGTQPAFHTAQNLDLATLLQFAALATVADMVPLTGANRIIAACGIALMNKRGAPGIAALKKISGIKRAITSAAISFQMAPRLNAAGRLARGLKTSGAMLAIRQLLANDRRQAERYALDLQLYNLERKRLEQEVWRGCLRQIRKKWLSGGGSLPAGLVLSGRGFHPGVLGICAARVAEKFNRPAIILAGPNKQGFYAGSGRSTPDLPLYECLKETAHLLAGFGGHDYAVGCQVHKNDLVALEAELSKAVERRRGCNPLAPQLTGEVETTLKELSLNGSRLIDDLQKLEPAGKGNPPANLLVKNALVLSATPIGPYKQHLKIFLRDAEGGSSAVEARLWRSKSHPALKPGALVNLVVRPQLEARSAFNPKRDKFWLEILALSES